MVTLSGTSRLMKLAEILKLGTFSPEMWTENVSDVALINYSESVVILLWV